MAAREVYELHSAPMWNTGCPIYCSGHRLDPDEPNHNGKDWPGVRNAGWTAKMQLGHVVNVRTEKNTHRALAVSINSEWSPLLTPEQARQVAAQLLEAADEQ